MRITANYDRHFWARPDDRHITAQYVKELWKLVDGRLAQESADRGDAPIRAVRRRRTIYAKLGTHRAQLVDREGSLEAAGSALGEENRCSVLDEDRQTCEQHDRRGENEEEHRPE